MNPTLMGVVMIAIGALSLFGGLTGSPILVAMLGGRRGRAPNTALTRMGMGMGGVIVLVLGVLLVGGYLGASTPTP